MEERKTYQVKVRVHKHLSIDLDVPAEMDASEFHSLMSMAKKVGNIRPEYADSGSKSKKSKSNSGSGERKGEWAITEEEILENTWKKSKSNAANARNVAAKLDRTPKQVLAKIYYWRRENPERYEKLTGQKVD